jgi:hypothetical protein
VGYPGQAGGTAVAETLFGLNNPAGRYPMTTYPKSYDYLLSDQCRCRTVLSPHSERLFDR